MWHAKSNQGATHKKATKPGIPMWFWLLALVATGLFVALIVYLVKLPPHPGEKIAHQTVESASKKKPAAEVAATTNNSPTKKEKTGEPRKPEEPQFGFFTELEKMKVDVPATQSTTTTLPPRNITTTTTKPVPSAVKNAAPSKPEKSAPTPSDKLPPGDRYILLAGSFESDREADALRARLALLGFESSIQKSTVGKGETRYRVRLGPYSSEQASQARERLRAQHINVVILKAR